MTLNYIEQSVKKLSETRSAFLLKLYIPAAFKNPHLQPETRPLTLFVSPYLLTGGPR